MTQTVHVLASRVPPPQKVPCQDSFVYRYAERSLSQAIVQKLARIITSLHSAYILMTHGFLQEQAALQRILGELHEDVEFLAYALIFDDFTPLHQEFLDAFYEEEFDADTPFASTQKRPMPRRKKIQSYIARKEGKELDPSTAIELSRTITKAYSGFVHAASPQIMDMYGGDPPHFHVEGMRNTEYHSEYRNDLWNYFYRSILKFGVATTAFGVKELCDEISKFIIEFERIAGKDYSPSSRSG